MIKAFFVDFYGTVVHEDGEVIKKITQIISDTSNAEDKGEIGYFWWTDFQKMFLVSYGDNFEKKSLEHTLEKFGSSADAEILSNMMFDHWVKPPIFEESKEFFESSTLPIYIVSNIDTSDILKAIEHHGLKPSGVFTSEDARSYNPRRELFELALKATGLKPSRFFYAIFRIQVKSNTRRYETGKSSYIEPFGIDIKSTHDIIRSKNTLTQISPKPTPI